MDHSDNGEPASGPVSPADPAETSDHLVGYGSPPMQRRFKLGQSGNKRGRPRGSKNRKTIVREIAKEMHAVTEDGNRRRRSTLELMLLALSRHAAAGNVKALRTLEKYLTKYEPQDTGPKLGVLVAPAEMTPDEWIRHAEETNEKMTRYGVRNIAAVRAIERREREESKRDSEQSAG